MRKDDHLDDDQPTPAPVNVDADEGKRSIEAWGEAKGMLPFIKPGETRGNAEILKFNTAKQWCKWADGQLVTEAEFDKGVADAMSQVQR
jgi:hypothetical protein